MVIHDESQIVVTLPVIKKPLFEPVSHVISNNTGMNYANSSGDDAPMCEPTEKSLKFTENVTHEKVIISKKKKKRHNSSALSESSESNSNKISAEDLEELRTLYKKCKSVISKIETKYWHLLDFDESGSSKKRSKNAQNTLDDEEAECQCTLNKKIVFDDNGKEILIDSASADHICPKKLKYSQQSALPCNDIQIEYYNEGIELPDNLQDLKTILQNPDLATTYRNLVIQKARLIKQEFAFEIKFNKHSIVEKLKTNVDEMLDFKGTNLSTLSGYVC